MPTITTSATSHAAVMAATTIHAHEASESTRAIMKKVTEQAA